MLEDNLFYQNFLLKKPIVIERVFISLQSSIVFQLQKVVKRKKHIFL